MVIILASASIPAIFPPVLFEVEANGKRYDELHVDGGAASQVFLYPTGLDWNAILEKLQVRGRPELFIIRNSRLDPRYEQVENKLFPIAGRSLEPAAVRGGQGWLTSRCASDTISTSGAESPGRRPGLSKRSWLW